MLIGDSGSGGPVRPSTPGTAFGAQLRARPDQALIDWGQAVRDSVYDLEPQPQLTAELVALAPDVSRSTWIDVHRQLRRAANAADDATIWLQPRPRPHSEPDSNPRPDPRPRLRPLVDPVERQPDPQPAPPQWQPDASQLQMSSSQPQMRASQLQMHASDLQSDSSNLQMRSSDLEADSSHMQSKSHRMRSDSHRMRSDSHRLQSDSHELTSQSHRLQSDSVRVSARQLDRFYASQDRRADANDALMAWLTLGQAHGYTRTFGGF